MFDPQTTFNRIRWLPVYNNTGAVIPAFAVVVVDSTNGSFRENQYVIPVRQFNGYGSTNSAAQIMVVGPNQIAANQYGLATFDFPAYVLYDSTTGSPLPNQTWGPSPGSFKVRSGRPGFTVLGGVVNPGGSGGQERVLAQWRWPPTLLGKTDAAINKGAAGAVSVYSGTPLAEADTGVNVVAYNKFANIGSDKWVIVHWVNAAWYMEAAEC